MLLRQSVLRAGGGGFKKAGFLNGGLFQNGRQFQNGGGQYNRIFHKHPLTLGVRNKDNYQSIAVNRLTNIPVKNIQRTLNLQGLNPNALSVRSKGTLPSRLVESSPSGLQPYLKLARLDKPVGNQQYKFKGTHYLSQTLIINPYFFALSWELLNRGYRNQAQISIFC